MVSYYPIAGAVFSLIGAILQLVVFLIYACGPHKFIPVAFLSIWFAYCNLSFFINTVEYSGPNFMEYWLGYGWCDLDILVMGAANIGILSAQLAICLRIFFLFKLKASRKTPRQAMWTNIANVLICVFIPIVYAVVHPFLTQNRYNLIQYQGCTISVSMSVPFVIFYGIVPFVLALLMLALTLVLVWQLYQRGKDAVFQNMSFRSKMTANTFIRTGISSLINAIVLCPLCFHTMASYISLCKQNHGFDPIPWLHGKPEGWSDIFVASYDLLSDAMLGALRRGMAFAYARLVLSYVAFFCYGTGSNAGKFYRTVYYKSGLSKLFSSETDVDVESTPTSGSFFSDKLDNTKVFVHHTIFTEEGIPTPSTASHRGDLFR